jgi:hypothetical protein
MEALDQKTSTFEYFWHRVNDTIGGKKIEKLNPKLNKVHFLDHSY